MAGPALSFVVVTDRFAYVREVVDAIRRQDERDRIELVIGTPSEAELGLDEDAIEGLDVHVVEIGRARLAQGRALAADASSAPYVFIGETHCFPQPGWAGALLTAHAEGWDTVVPVLSNANPRGALSWAAFLLAYGRNWAPAPARELGASPTYNASMRRELVAEHFVGGGQGFVDVPRRDGQRIFRAPDARMRHLNVTVLRTWLDERYVVGRLYGADRARGWSRARRAGYVAASPLLPLSQLRTVLRATGLRRFRELPPLTLPAMLLGSAVSVAGEVVSYAGGPPAPDVIGRIDDYEIHRLDYAARG
jgi:hypothetical protein